MSDVNKSLSAKSFNSNNSHGVLYKQVTYLFFQVFCLVFTIFEFLSRSLGLLFNHLLLHSYEKQYLPELAMISVHVIILNIYRPVSWMNVVLKQRKNNKKVSLGSLHYYYSSIKTRNICMEKVLTRNHVQDPIVYNISFLVTFLELFVELLWIRMRWRKRFGLNFILTFFEVCLWE